MIEYVIHENPDQRVLDRVKMVLDAGEIVALPTDTNWVLVANPFNKNAVEKIYKMKGEEKSHHFSLLCADVSMATDIAFIPDDVYRLIRPAIPGHYTFIFDATKKMIRSLKASKSDHQVGVRFVPSLLVQRLLETTTYPLLSTNIAPRMLGLEDEQENTFYSFQLEEALGPHLAAIIDPGEYTFAGASTIYNFTGSVRECTRVGAGPELF